MNALRVKRLLTVTAITTAALAGAAATATASPAPATGSSSVSAPDGITVQGLIAARNAGIPIYEAVRAVRFSQPSTGPNATFDGTEYRRVYNIDDLSTPTTKFVGVGAVAPDNFYVGLRGGSVLVNPHEYVQPNVGPGFIVFDGTPYTFTNSPLVHLPDGGPSVGVALIR
ncbi:hypothetical protein [Prescottella agglutinans]|uniref:Uncharacterized protein n=1 Tax=Prescottella agglutinans TaxID=1644129 RepID=A0ABT6MG97_9NOCA|nr:hypothetical protein [Prescottella agglutinans]MDH6283255.1 hypothetical protein [Prescottella agglutinans]